MPTHSHSTDVDPTTTTSSSNNEDTTTNTYEYIFSYNFASDPEFRNGLGTILGHPGTPASDTELRNDADDVVLQAKCFYISRKRNICPAINFMDYRNWKLQNGLILSSSSSNSNSNDKNAAVASSSSSSSTQLVQDEKSEKATEPAYPSSFAHIVELITNNQPIPGIEEIPDTVLSGHDEPSKATRRRKPWEKNEDSSNS